MLRPLRVLPPTLHFAFYSVVEKLVRGERDFLDFSHDDKSPPVVLFDISSLINESEAGDSIIARQMEQDRKKSSEVRPLCAMAILRILYVCIVRHSKLVGQRGFFCDTAKITGICILPKYNVDACGYLAHHFGSA